MVTYHSQKRVVNMALFDPSSWRVAGAGRWGVRRPRHHVAEAQALHVRRVTLQAHQVTAHGLGEGVHPSKMCVSPRKNGGIYGI